MPVTRGVRAAHSREALQKQPIVGELLIALADHDQPVATDGVAERGVGGELSAARERQGAPVPRADLPLVERVAVDFIREAQAVEDHPDAAH